MVDIPITTYEVELADLLQDLKEVARDRMLQDIDDTKYRAESYYYFRKFENGQEKKEAIISFRTVSKVHYNKLDKFKSTFRNKHTRKPKLHIRNCRINQPKPISNLKSKLYK